MNEEEHEEEKTWSYPGKRRGVRPGEKRGTYKKRKKKKPQKNVWQKIKDKPPKQWHEIDFDILKPKETKPREPNIEIRDAEGNIIREKRPPHKLEKGVVLNPKGRPKGSRNRSTVVREILHALNWGKNPITGREEGMSQEYRMTLAILNKALKGDVNAYKALMDNSYKPHAQEVENKHVAVDLTGLTAEEIKGMLKDNEDDDE